jgi:CRP/FNR family transcriptional regulator, dissimilatory nitrate respiration regulator
MKTIRLADCPVCSALGIENEDEFLANLNCKILEHYKNELIIRQGSICDALYVLVKGSVKTEMITDAGNVMRIETILAPRPLAPAFLFSDDNHFPVDVTSLEDVEILKIPHSAVLQLMTTNPKFMNQFLKFNSNRTQFLTNRLQLLSIKTIRGKIAHYLIEQSKGESRFVLPKNQTELSEIFSVARPSLARSLAELADEGMIKLEKKTVTILDLNQLKKEVEK